MAATAASSSSIRSWRTAFLTLRDETLTPPPRTSLPQLLHNLLFSQSHVLVPASLDLSPHEVMSDVMLLMELVVSLPDGEEAAAETFTPACDLIHDVSCQVHMEMNPSSRVLMLDFLEKIVRGLLCRADTKNACLESSTRLKVSREILEVIRNCSFPESTKLIKLLLQILLYLHAESFSIGHQRYAVDIGSRIPKYNNIWEIQTVAFDMLGDVFSRFGSSVSMDVWQSILEVLRKVMDALTSRTLLLEDNVMSRFYTSLLHCLHLVLSNPKGSLSEHVAGFVASLQMFFMYGVKAPSVCPNPGSKEKVFSSLCLNSKLGEATTCKRGPYRPPHLRKREGMSSQPLKAWDSKSFSDHEASASGISSSDSEHSDSDGSIKVADRFRCSKARIAAIICIQDLCQAVPKSLSAHCTVLLPTSDVLHARKHQATLMTCLLFDPILKTRITSASAIATMLDGLSSTFMQVAEYKESTKCGSFTTLSSSLGQILMQLHTGLLHLIQHETHSSLLLLVFKILMLLISATPYARMPGELLPAVVSTVHTTILQDLSRKADQSGLLATALSCLGTAMSTSPPMLQVAEMLQNEILAGDGVAQSKSNILSVLFQFSQQVIHPTISFEALQTLRAASHNYPNAITACWEEISATIYGLLRVNCHACHNYEVPSRLWKGDAGNTLGPIVEKCIVAAVKVLDENLRAASGFKGTDELLDDKFLVTPFTSDCTRTKKISSAPSYELDAPEVSRSNLISNFSGNKQWCEAIEKHLPLTLSHTSPAVRAASLTCFAGMTSSVFFSLTNEKQDLILSSVITSALNDGVPSVRSAACRAIGVIACFPKKFYSAEILDDFIHAAEINTHDQLVSVRITASWALANICDCLRHRALELNLEKCYSDLNTNNNSVSVIADSLLRLTKDGDKIKSNAVRALGNLSRFVSFTSQSSVCDGSMNGNSHWLEEMVQAFVSCVTTGNVKVQWNVCHALGNLFLNETVKLKDMTWAPSVYSILLLLVRDSTNYKIRIHAAAALAVPASRFDYGSSFPDVVQGLVLVLENLGLDQVSGPSSFKYKATLEKQLTSTTLHVLGLASSSETQPLKDFLAKKASLLEEWLKSLCSSLAYEVSDQSTSKASIDIQQDGLVSSHQQKKAMMSKALRSLLEIYESSNNQSIARRFEKLVDCL